MPLTLQLHWPVTQDVQMLERGRKSLNVINVTHCSATVVSGAQAQAPLTEGQCARGSRQSKSTFAYLTALFQNYKGTKCPGFVFLFVCFLSFLVCTS